MSCKVALQSLQLPEGPGMALALGEASRPHQPQLLLHMLQLKVKTLPVDTVLPRVTWAYLRCQELHFFWRTRKRKNIS